MLERIKQTASFIQERVSIRPGTGIILGTGLGGLVNEITRQEVLNYHDIPHFPVSTVEGHQGRLIFGFLGEKPVVAMQGRFHFYEGYSMKEVTFPVRVLKFLGVELLVVSNASGGLNPHFEVGDMMIITDHINLFPEHPLRGPNEEKLGVRFPDMSQAYDHKLITQALAICAEEGIRVQKGVYAGVSGPTFETPAEYLYLARMGADAVGMSTVPEVIAARHMNMTCFALSVISDLGVENKIVKITHEEVQQAARAVEPRMTTLVKRLIGSRE
jgi:purine-nucleoside phosphorylase